MTTLRRLRMQTPVCPKFLLAWLWMLTGVLSDTAAQLPTIELTSLSQPAVQAGAKVQLSVQGSRTDELENLIFSDDRIASTVLTAPAPFLSEQRIATGKFEVSIAAEVSPGGVEVRAAGRFGVSNPRKLLITGSPVLQTIGEHSDPALAPEIVQGTIYTDQLRAQRRNYFRISAATGERLHCVVYARQIDSRATPVLVLYDSSGQELARHRGAGEWPAEIDYEISETADYVLAVHDFLYQGGPEYAVLLEAALTPHPEPDTALELNQLLRPVLKTAVSSSRTSGLALVNAMFEKPPTPLQQAKLAKPADPIWQPPFSTQGSLREEPSTYTFRAGKGESFWIEVQSSQFGQLTDPRLVVYRVASSNDAGAEQLTQLADQDDAPYLGNPAMRIRNRDPQIAWTAPEDATYRIVITDNESGPRPADAVKYVLNVRRPEPNFALLAFRPFPSNNVVASRHFGSNLMRGGTECVQVIAIRKDGFTGPIEVQVEGLPGQITCPSTTIHAGTSEATLVLNAPETAEAWHGSLQVVGKASLNGQTITANATYGTIVWGSIPTRNSVQSRIAKDLWTLVNADDLAPLLVTVGNGQTMEVKVGTKLSIPVKVTRREGGKAACLLRPQNLPPKASIGEFTIAADKDEAIVDLTIAADATPGDYTFWMQNETKVKWRANPQSLSRAEEYLAKLNSTRDNSSDKSALETAIKDQSDLIETLKKQTATQDITAWIPTTAIRIRILPADSPSAN